MRALLRSLVAILLAVPALAGGKPAAIRPVAAVRGAPAPLSSLSAARLLPAPRTAEQLFSAAVPGSEAVAFLGPSFAEAAGDLAQHGTIMAGSDPMESAMRMVPEGTPNRQRVAAAISQVLAFIGRAPADAEADAFVTAIADAHARKAFEAAAGPNGEKLAGRDPAFVKRGGLMKGPVSLPRSPLPSGEYWDVASGTPELVVGGLDEGVSYRFIDISPFMVRAVNSFIAKLGAAGQDMSNVRMEEGDAMALKKPDAPLAVIRAKNVVAYVPEFATKLAEMSGWLAPGGAIYIQNDPGIPWRRTIMQAYTPLALGLLMDGWTMAARYAARSEAAYDLLSFTKPAAGEPARLSPENAQAAWQRYIDEAAAVSAEELKQQIHLQFVVDAFPKIAKALGVTEVLR